MRNRFDSELELLGNELIEMGALIETAIGQAVDALCRQDMALAQQIIERDSEIDEKEREIERHCLKLLLQQQPVAADLRLVSTALKMITDMERIGDHAGDISELTILLTTHDYIHAFEPIPQMAQVTIQMVKQSIDAFVRKNLSLAEAVIARDDEVDDLFDEVKRKLIKKIRANDCDGEQSIDMLLVAKYFERIGDHAVNIAEWVIFSITGRHKDQRIL